MTPEQVAGASPDGEAEALELKGTTERAGRPPLPCAPCSTSAAETC